MNIFLAYFGTRKFFRSAKCRYLCMVIGLICAAGGGKFWAGAINDYSINNLNQNYNEVQSIYQRNILES